MLQFSCGNYDDVALPFQTVNGKPSSATSNHLLWHFTLTPVLLSLTPVLLPLYSDPSTGGCSIGPGSGLSPSPHKTIVYLFAILGDLAVAIHDI